MVSVDAGRHACRRQGALVDLGYGVSATGDKTSCAPEALSDGTACRGKPCSLDLADVVYDRVDALPAAVVVLAAREHSDGFCQRCIDRIKRARVQFSCARGPALIMRLIALEVDDRFAVEGLRE